MPRKVIHIDLDAFYCSVEERRNPALRGKAFAVGGKPEERGVISSCSYAARQKGVRSAMPTGRALRLCPEMLVLPPDFSAYHAASQQVMERLFQVTPLVEQISIDEAFLDVTALSDDPEDIARRLQARIHSELELPCSLGIASNKLVAKIATDVGKSVHRAASPPNALTVVPEGAEAEFLAPLPVIALWGIGPKTAARMAEMGIYTIGDLAKWSEYELIKRFGKNGHDLYLHARGIDDRPVVTTHEAKSISREVTYARDIGEPSILFATLHELAEDVAQRLQREALSGITIKLKLRWHDFTTLSRQTTLPAATQEAETIYQEALKLLNAVWQPGRKVRLIGVGVSKFTSVHRQLSLWDVLAKKNDRLEKLRSDFRRQYGDHIILTTSRSKRDET